MLEALVSKADYVTPVPDFHGQPEKTAKNETRRIIISLYSTPWTPHPAPQVDLDQTSINLLIKTDWPQWPSTGLKS
jgi:hypothetical protein